ncbi:hypothetical protein AQUCO_04900017v1 [Aquilegia coerulea]|uniref:Uncharacterized protein n=1 Tax=Aquilegia coerulea TaxID=218851 RepID=A0A2G5CJD7_AQUCA|nr:hypothetical protein AQUCO_04900017v1 [Aquilegia coerulea]
MASAISKPFTLLLLLTVLLLASSIMHVESIPAPVYPVECIVRCKTAIPTCIKNCFGSGRSTSNGGSNKSNGRSNSNRGSNSNKGGSNSNGGRKYCIIPCKEDYLSCARKCVPNKGHRNNHHS